MVEARAASSSTMIQQPPTPLEELEKSPLKSLNGTRDKFLADFDSANLTEEYQQEAAHFLSRLDCLSVSHAADIACAEH